MKFATQRENRKKILEQNKEPRITETAGYIPAVVRITNIMQAGARLKEYRAEQYDFGDGQVNPEFFDPTRSPNFDLADAGILQNATHERLVEQQEAAQAARDKKAKEEKEEFRRLKEDALKAQIDAKIEKID